MTGNFALRGIIGSVVLMAMALLASNLASAALGGSASTADADRNGMKIQRRMLPAQPRYTVQESRLPSGTVVREYVSPSGRVFAVAWEGPQMPDLEEILGEHYSAYRAAAREKRRGPGRRNLEAGDLVVQSGGHMRAFAGRAWLRQLMPEGVRPDEIR